MQVILSQPIPPLEATSSAKMESNISSTKEARLSFPFFFFNYSATYVTDSYEVIQSHIPSHAHMIKSESFIIFSTVISGNAVII